MQSMQARNAAGTWQLVTSRVAGNFPGSPVDLRYRFRLRAGDGHARAAPAHPSSDVS
jgi:hypothetical protein